MSGTQDERGRRAVILGGRRTPIGRFLGSISAIPASELGATAIRGALEATGIAPDQVDRVIMGQVLTAGAGQIPSRQAAAAAGIPMSVPSTTINKVCLSGIAAVAQAALEVRADGAGVIVAGGQESMSLAPHLLRGRTGTKYGEITMADHAALDGLTDSFTGVPMGLLTEQLNDADPISREEQDAFAVASHRRAAAAWEAGLFTDEVVPVLGRNGETLLERDESVRPSTDASTLGRLRPSFRPDGTITAGNASPLSDGAAALIVAEAGRAAEFGVEPLAEILASASVAGPDSSLQHQPSRAIRAACERAGIDPSELAVVEINEAFAAVGIASTRDLGIDPEKVNVGGGAIALGHPIGMSGARILLHLALELRRRGGGIGAAALCGGGGQGDAILLRV